MTNSDCPDGPVTSAMRQKLETEFQPQELEILDDSEKHRGHGGYREGGESHFAVVMVSDKFTGKSRVERQRMVMRTLAEELAGPVHALQLRISAPGE